MKSSAFMLSFCICLGAASGVAAQQPDLPLSQSTSSYHAPSAIMQFAYERATADGHDYPQLLLAILIKETGGGRSPSFHRHKAGPGHCYGIAQMTLSTVKGVLKKHEELFSEFNFKGKSDKEIQSKLISDDKFSIAVASKYLVMLRDSGFTSHSSQAVAYNQGEGSARRTGSSSKYSRSVMQIASRME